MDVQRESPKVTIRNNRRGKKREGHCKSKDRENKAYDLTSEGVKERESKWNNSQGQKMI